MSVLIIFRGMPGSGKSSLARLLVPEFNVAADDFMTDKEGNYLFDPSLLSYCHRMCQGQVEIWMEEKQQTIAVHNTFTTLREMNPYLHLAERYGYQVHVVHVEHHHEGNNVHGCPEEKLTQMASRWYTMDKHLRGV